MFTQTFRRNEVKYIVNEEQYKRLNNELINYMDYDNFCPNGNSYMIYNIYFDTQNDDIIRHSIDKPYYKEKLRLRSYKIPTEQDDRVFLELKKKIGNVVAKRRAILHYKEAIQFVENGILPQTATYQDRQVAAEIADFLQRNAVTPKAYISYERIAFAGKEEIDFRISFDRNIITRRQNVSLTDCDYGNELLDSDTYIMEIKCTDAMPLWLTSILSELKLYKTSFSKYGTEYKQYIKRGVRIAC